MLGSGTEQDPYLLETVDDVLAMRNGTTSNWRYYKLANDIELPYRSSSFPISVQRSRIVLDGDGYKFTKLNIRVTGYSSSDEQTGIFSRIYDFHVKNLGIENFVFIGYAKTGTFAGQTGGDIQFDNCYVADSTIRAYSTMGQDLWRYFGGFVGYVASGTVTFNNCFFRSNSSRSVEGTSYVGGFIGGGGGTKIFNSCYFRGDMISSHRGRPYVFSDGSGVTTNNSYYVKHVSSRAVYNNDATMLDDERLKDPVNLEGFDFDNVWGYHDDYNRGFPIQKIFLPQETPPIIKDVSVSNYVNAITTDYLLNLIVPIIKEISTGNYINQIQTDYIIDYVKANVKTVNTDNYVNAVKQFVAWVNLVHPIIKEIQVAHKLQPITTGVTVDFVKALVKEVNTLSSIKNLSQDAKRLQFKKSIENLISHLNKITGQTVVVSDIKEIEFYAMASHLEKRNVLNFVEMLTNAYINQAKHSTHQLQPKTEVRVMAFKGDTITLNVRFRSSNGNAIDPTDVTMKMFKPTMISYELIETISLTSENKVDVGEYEIEYTIPSDIEINHQITSKHLVAEFSGMYNGNPTLTRERIPIRFI